MLRASAVTVSMAGLAASLLLAAPSATAEESSIQAPATCEEGVAIRTAPRLNGRVAGRCYSTHQVTKHRLVEGDMVDCVDGPGRPTHANYWAYITDNTTGVTGYATICYVH